MSVNPYQTPNVDFHAVVDDGFVVSGQRYNNGLVIVHGVFGFLYTCVTLALLIGTNMGLFSLGVITLFAAIAAAHLYGAIGARVGSNASRRVTRILGMLMLVGFPVGTAIGFYLLMRTSDTRWQSPRGR